MTSIPDENSGSTQEPDSNSLILDLHLDLSFAQLCNAVTLEIRTNNIIPGNYRYSEAEIIIISILLNAKFINENKVQARRHDYPGPLVTMENTWKIKILFFYHSKASLMGKEKIIIMSRLPFIIIYLFNYIFFLFLNYLHNTKKDNTFFINMNQGPVGRGCVGGGERVGVGVNACTLHIQQNVIRLSLTLVPLFQPISNQHRIRHIWSDYLWSPSSNLYPIGIGFIWSY